MCNKGMFSFRNLRNQVHCNQLLASCISKALSIVAHGTSACVHIAADLQKGNVDASSDMPEENLGRAQIVRQNTADPDAAAKHRNLQICLTSTFESSGSPAHFDPKIDKDFALRGEASGDHDDLCPGGKIRCLASQQVMIGSDHHRSLLAQRREGWQTGNSKLEKSSASCGWTRFLSFSVANSNLP